MNEWWRGKAMGVLMLLAAAVAARGQEGTISRRGEAPQVDQVEQNVNLPVATLGGKQFWSDELVFRDWRIQRNALTEHCRLLDPANVRHAWGTLNQCQAQLAVIKRERRLPPMQGKAVIVLHGIRRSRSSMEGLCRYLEEQGGLTVINVSYASTQARLESHAQSLARIIDSLEGVEEINFVAHSMGNLVIRHYLGDHMHAEQGLAPDARIRRIVMLGPPNNGTQLAARFKNNQVFRLIWGASGIQMGAEWADLQRHLATPCCQFGILAGGVGESVGGNPLLEGDDDLVVTIDETRLDGAHDFRVVPVGHSSIMQDRRVRAYTLRFLQHGFFVSEATREPIRGSRAMARTPR